MCCSYIVVLANPNMKLGIQFIIMKIFMKIVKICPKSPRFTVIKWKFMHTAIYRTKFSHGNRVMQFQACFFDKRLQGFHKERTIWIPVSVMDYKSRNRDIFLRQDLKNFPPGK